MVKIMVFTALEMMSEDFRWHKILVYVTFSTCRSMNTYRHFWSNLYNRRIFLIACFIHKYFTMNSNNTRAGLDTCTFVVARASRVGDELMFNNCFCKLWNKLPSEIRCNDKKDYLLRFQNECKNNNEWFILRSYEQSHIWVK